jgi:hypothetical protein
LFLKLPISSFFFVSTLMIGRPVAVYFPFWEAM